MSYKLSRRSFLAGAILAPVVPALIGCGSGGGNNQSSVKT